MNRLHRPDTTGLAALAAFTTWVTLFSWRGLTSRPAEFLVPLLAAGLLCAASGLGLRAARVPRALVPFGQLAVLALWWDHRLAAAEAIGGWVPTSASVARVTQVVEHGISASQRFAPPVPESAVSVTALFVGLGCVAFVAVDLLAVTLRRVPLAGLPLLLLYTVPVTILSGGVSWWVFVASAMSFCVLLATQEALRLRHWGRRLGTATDSRSLDSLHTAVSGGSMRAAARRIGAVSTGLALAVPVVLPTLSVDLFHGGPGSGRGGHVSIDNPIVDLRRDLSRGRDVDLVTVLTAEPHPGYLRISVLDAFDGTSWKPSPREIPVGNRIGGRMPSPPGLDPDVTSHEVPYDVYVGSNFDSQWLPTPYPIASIKPPQGDWRVDRSTSDIVSAAEGQSAAHTAYSVQALDVRVKVSDLVNARPAPSNVQLRYTRLPDNVPESVRHLAERVTSGATSKFDAAALLQRWFRVGGGFRYSLARAPGNGTNDLVRFLSKGGRVGYCEQFAAAMAVMGRELGIPSRVAVGFLRPEAVGGHEWVYSAHDLHAWPEMYFEGVGWIRFEPTPQQRTGSVPSYTHVTGGAPAPTSRQSAEEPARPQGRFDRTQGPLRGSNVGDRSTGGAPNLLPWVGGLLVLVLLLLVPRLVRSWRRTRRWRSATSIGETAEAAWAELRDTARDLGSRWSDEISPRAMAHTLATGFGIHEEGRRSPRTGVGVDPEADRALERVTVLLERARYAREEPSPEPTGRAVHDDVACCTAAMAAGASRNRQRRARWWPGSVTGRLTPRRGEDQPVLPAGVTGAVDHAV